jgi:hypothetical protein
MPSIAGGRMVDEFINIFAFPLKFPEIVTNLLIEINVKTPFTPYFHACRMNKMTTINKSRSDL